MSSDLDAVCSQHSVELTAGLVVELEDYLNEAIAAFAERIAEVGGDLVRLFTLASVRIFAFGVGGENVTAQKAWSQREARQQGQHQESFCSMVSSSMLSSPY